MKKGMIGMLMVVAMLGMFSTGCATTRNGYPNTSVSGDVPKLGSKVYVYNVIGRESVKGPYETVIVWEYFEGDGVRVGGIRTVTTKGFSFSGLDSKDPKGYYIVGKDTEVDIQFYPIK